ncbi:two-component system response regulator [Paenibacillus sp. Soil766]|uniref:response regulator transcription factor n=1 Tax=Paenibacillus sp. Soil766 TaxID=1736404 RepID=UPI00070C78BA|nr:response regulator [Paenibacillus sp. Soil766]KRF06792.1 two-component system response regulator [Paenibacillus sp. Soil766]
MYRIMLVDDEVGVRNSIKAKIDWASAGFAIALEAANGLEALQLLGEQPLPDIVITDVRMPQMDGIAFVNACKEKYPGLRIIVLSGYSDFEYMKAAIQLGVKDYLLKPVVRSELTALLGKLAAELEEDRNRIREQDQEEIKNHQQLGLMQEQLLWQLVKDEWFSVSTMKERMVQLQLSDLAIDEVHAQFVTVEMRIPPGRLDDWSDRKDLLYLAFQLLCRESTQKWEYVYPFYAISHPAMMHYLILIQNDEHERFIADFVRKLKRDIQTYLKVDSVLGIGEHINGLKQLKDGYASSMLAWSQGTVHLDKAQPNQNMLAMTHTFSQEVERKLMQTIENLDMLAFTKQLHAIFSANRDTPMFVFTFLTLRIILLFNAIAKKFELGDASLQRYLWNCQMTVRDYSSREQVLEQLHDMAQLVMDEVRKTRFSSGQQMMEAIRNYVEENFSYELTLASLADMFHLNETYLSGLFKQNVGVTFSDYVTRLRLNRALVLLKESELKLTEIATLVGYSSSSYFSTAFKKFYGKGPKEYREELRSERNVKEAPML